MEQPEMDSEVVVESASDDESQNIEQLETEVEEQVEEEDEIDVDGRKFSLPKSAAEKLKAERLMQADYTRKTQEVADLRKNVERQAEETKQRAAFQEAYLNDVAEVVSIDKQLSQYNQIDWQKLIDEDPVQAMKLEHQFKQLQEAKNQAVNALTQKQQTQHWEQQQATAKQLQEGQAVLARDIPNWSPDLARQLVDYGVSTGVDRHVIESITDPNQVKLIHKAFLYDQIVKKQTTKPQAAPVAPVTRIAAKTSGAQKDPDKMSSDEWLKWRNSQVRSKK